MSDSDDRLIEKYEPVADAARRREPRLTAISPVLDRPGLIVDGDRSNSILLRGFDFAGAEKLYEFSERLVAGRLPERDSQAVIGLDLAKELGVQLGDSIEVTVLGSIKKSFTLVGVFDLEVQSVNKSWFLANLAAVQDLFATGDAVTAIEIQIGPDEVFEADLISEN